MKRGKVTMISDKIKEYRTFLDKSNFKETKSLLQILDTCHSVEDFQKVLETAKAYYKDGIIPELEYFGFESLIESILESEPMKNSVYSGNDILAELKKRIWTTTDIGKVIQFRNIVTDMLMLDFIQLGEYIELSNEIDRYIQYTLSNGGIK